MTTDNTAAMKLLPCPVCQFPHVLVPEATDEGFYVMCGDPDCWASCEGSTPENAIKRWNTRSQPQVGEDEAVEIMESAYGPPIGKGQGLLHHERMTAAYRALSPYLQEGRKAIPSEYLDKLKSPQLCEVCDALCAAGSTCKVCGHGNKSTPAEPAMDKERDEDALIYALDKIARDHCPYEYGLPIDGGEMMDLMREGVKASSQQRTGWQPIESAPKDGTEIIAFWQYMYPGDRSRTCGQRMVEWNNEHKGWEDFEGVHHVDLFTHWMLPTPPEEK